MMEKPPKSPPAPPAPARGERGVRMQTLLRLRWLAVLGQVAAVMFVYFGLRFDMPFWPAVLVIALTAWLNIFLTLRWRAAPRLSEPRATLLLAFDIVQLAALLFLTGGLLNPFSFLFLAPVIISATVLPSGRTLALGALAMALITALAFFHMPLPWRPQGAFDPPPLYIWGMWGALVSGIVFTAVYVHRIARESHEMADALAAAELALARQQQLYALDGLAAAAAHELGTPLATIALVAKELRRGCARLRERAGRRERKEREDMCEDIDLLLSQAERCRDILARLSGGQAAGDDILARVRLTAMLEEIIGPMRGPDVDLRLAAHAPAAAPEPVIARNPGVIYGLGNIVENACDFAAGQVVVEAEWDEEEIAVTISDDGEGFSEEIIDRLGEPYVTTRGDCCPGEEEDPADAARPGMGLGLFIAKTLLERTGAILGFANRPAPEHGAIVRVAWPRGAIEAQE